MLRPGLVLPLLTDLPKLPEGSFDAEMIMEFGHGNALRLIDTGMSAEIIGGETGNCEIKDIACAKELGAHECAGDRRIGGGSKNCDESETCKQINGCTAGSGDGIAQGGADKEQWRHLASLESHAQRDGGEQEFPEPTEAAGAAGKKGRLNTHAARRRIADAQAEIIEIADQQAHG